MCGCVCVYVYMPSSFGSLTKALSLSHTLSLFFLSFSLSLNSFSHSHALPFSHSLILPFSLSLSLFLSLPLSPLYLQGHGANMANFRHAQTASFGVLPGPAGSGMENTFIAQAYDAGDPSAKGAGFHSPNHGAPDYLWSSTRSSMADQTFQASYDPSFSEGRLGHSSKQAFTAYYMGGIHPRPKQFVGRRLALGARAIAYLDEDVVFTGPVLAGCRVGGLNEMCTPNVSNPEQLVCHAGGYRSGLQTRQLTLNFRTDLLKDDAVKVWKTGHLTNDLALVAMYGCINATCIESCASNATCAAVCALRNTPLCKQGRVVQNVGPKGVCACGVCTCPAHFPLSSLGSHPPPLEMTFLFR